MNAKELKKWLVSEGFQVYRTLASAVVLADRARENLILDSGVQVVAADPFAVRVTIRETTKEQPDLEPEERFQRLRQLANECSERGYRIVGRSTTPIASPSNPDVVLDTWYELTLERTGVDQARLAAELRYALEHNRSRR